MIASTRRWIDHRQAHRQLGPQHEIQLADHLHRIHFPVLRAASKQQAVSRQAMGS